MKMSIKQWLIAGLTVITALPLAAKEKPRAFNAEDMVSMNRVGSPVLSPNGQWVAYSQRRTELEKDVRHADIWVRSLDGKRTIQLTSNPASDGSPVWSSDGQSLYFLSSRSGSRQVWKIALSGGEAQQVSHLPLSVGTFKLSADNHYIVFSANVFPDCKTLECTKQRDEAQQQEKHSGMVYDQLFMRHWDHWLDGKQSRLFSGKIVEGNVQDVRSISHSVNGNVPSRPFGGSSDYTLSTDSKYVYFSARLADRLEPTSTNFDIYRVDIAGKKRAKNLTEKNLAADIHPVVSPDGKTLAYLAMRRPGFESDRLEVVMHDLKKGKKSYLTENWDRSFGDLQFSTDGQQLYLSGSHMGTRTLWRLDLKSRQHQQLVQGGSVRGFSVSDKVLVFGHNNLIRPTELFVHDLQNGKNTQFTDVNRDTLQQLRMGDYEQFSFKGWNDETVYGYVTKPANYRKGKKYPVAFLIHGGPQGSFGDQFHYRWNPQTYAGQGFATVFIDFHGSTGYGQAFTDSITGDWGGKPLEDLQKGLAYATKQFKFLDADNVCALGASYGGYMINWIAGNWPDRFKCLVNHDGIFDNRMMYYATEELWFVEWENHGPQFKSPENYEKHNPANHVAQWKTPMLVIQGEKDYRVPVTQAIATFTALQRQGIESRFLYFPDENHWVLKPHNSLQWHEEVNKWLHRHLD